jgi:sulfate adenylyltransferase subunit 1 (EFTu-like GTPase family)
MNKYLRIVVTGDVDSGKSTLIGRLLSELNPLSRHLVDEVSLACQRLGRDFEFAYLLDSLEEERHEERTIDTTQVFCKAGNGLEIVFIDVPGHQELLHNMLSGTSQADAAVLVVDAGKPITAQARRQAFILEFLGIKSVVVALNKMDAVGFQEQAFERIKAGIEEFLKSIHLAPGSFVPISAKQGENLIIPSKLMEWYNGLSLIEVLSSEAFSRKLFEAHAAFDKEGFVFLVQDIYRLNRKKVAVGPLERGSVALRSRCRVLPGNTENRVEKIVALDRPAGKAVAPAGAGLILQDMSCLKRGDVICGSGILGVRREFPAKIFCLKQLQQDAWYDLKCGTQETPARLSEITRAWETSGMREVTVAHRCLEENTLAQVNVSAEKPLVTEDSAYAGSLGRFVLRGQAGDIEAVGMIS